MHQTKSTPTWRARFFLLWGSQSASQIGTEIVQFGIAWWLTIETGSPSTLATALAVGLLPTVALGPFAGVLVDRWSRRIVLMLSDGLIAVSTAALLLLMLLDVAQPWHVYGAIFVRALGETVHRPTMIATTSLMVPKEHLARIAGIDGTMLGIARFVAPAIGAVLLTVSTIEVVLVVDLVTAAIAILPLFFLRIPQPGATGKAQAGVSSVWSQLGDGLRYAWRTHGIRYSLLAMMLL